MTITAKQKADWLTFQLEYLSNEDPEAIESNDYEVYGETEQGADCSCTIQITDLAAEALSTIERLVEHSATLSIALRDDDTDAATEHWRSLPDHIQAMINQKSEELDNTESEL